MALFAGKNLLQAISKVTQKIESYNKSGNTDIEILSQVKQLIPKFKEFLEEVKDFVSCGKTVTRGGKVMAGRDILSLRKIKHLIDL